MLFHTIGAVFHSGLQGAVEWFFGEMSPAERVGMVAGAVTALVGGFVAWKRKNRSYECQIENLKKIVYSMRSERYYYVNTALRYYDIPREQGRTIYKEGWVQPKDDEQFLKLEDVAVTVTDAERDVRPDENTPSRWDSKRNPRPAFLPTPREGFAENVKFHCGAKLVNRPLYALHGVTVEGSGGNAPRKVKLTLKRGMYFDFYDTCEVLLAEMAYERRILHRDLCTEAKLPLREKNGDVFNLDNRFAGVGVNALTIFNNVYEEGTGETHSYFLVHQRSETDVAEGCGCLHVVPAGSHQPQGMEFPSAAGGENGKDDPTMLSTVLREFEEELLGRAEFENLSTDKLLNEENLSARLGEVYFLGICLEPVNTKAEILACLKIDARKEELRDICRTNAQIEKWLQNNYEGSISLVRMTQGHVEQYRNDPMSTPSFSQIMQIVGEHPLFFGVEQGSAASAPSQD